MTESADQPVPPDCSTEPDRQHDHRLAELCDWIGRLGLPMRCQIDSIRPASSDASFRRYFRFDTDASDDTASPATLIAMDAPPPQENCAPFVHAATVFRDAGVHTPKILASNLDAGFLLLEDLGQTTLLDQLQRDPQSSDGHYRQASQTLIKLQQASRPGVFAHYDHATLLREMQLFDQWYLTTHLGYRLSADERKILADTYALIISNNLSQPTVFVHRDYHSRNLMIQQAQAPGVIDFQDALYGPITYDLVSLLRDAYICWPEEKVLDWAIRYWEGARQAGLPVHEDFGEFYRDFEWMGLQRHLKVLGIFARLCHRDGKSAYLSDIPLVRSYVVKAARRFHGLGALAALIEQAQAQAEE